MRSMQSIRFRPPLLTALVLSLALTAAPGGFGGTTVARAQQGGVNVCPPQRFALCSYAPCRPIPGTPDKALCDCDVFDDVAVGNGTCEERAPSTGAYGLETVVSAFSLIEIPDKPLLTCPEGTRWTQCLDAPCFVDPANPKKAACTCDVETAGVAQTYGGDCNVATCETAFWSAATPAQVQGGIDAISKHLGIDPPKNRVCPAS